MTEQEIDHAISAAIAQMDRAHRKRCQTLIAVVRHRRNNCPNRGVRIAGRAGDGRAGDGRADGLVPADTAGLELRHFRFGFGVLVHCAPAE